MPEQKKNTQQLADAISKRILDVEEGTPGSTTRQLNLAKIRQGMAPAAPAPEPPPTPTEAPMEMPAEMPADTAPAAQPAEPPADAGQPLIEMHDIHKSYYIGQPNELEILHGIDLTVYPGQFVAIVGESGSGKSTLMNIIGVLDKPTTGSYTLDGVDIHTAKDNDLAAIRNKKIGFVFQTYNLIGRQSALKNVELPMLYAGVPAGERDRRAKEWLERVGMGDRAKHQPNELSGGQKQRVAIARAMVNEPALILADEPTGALDSETSRSVMDMFHEMHEKYQKTIVLITHNPELADECERVLTLRDGRIVAERKGSGKRGLL